MTTSNPYPYPDNPVIQIVEIHKQSSLISGRFLSGMNLTAAKGTLQEFNELLSHKSPWRLAAVEFDTVLIWFPFKGCIPIFLQIIEQSNYAVSRKALIRTQRTLQSIFASFHNLLILENSSFFFKRTTFLNT